ncbi:MAG: protein TolQ [Thermodesulfobacteriota bacterium]
MNEISILDMVIDAGPMVKLVMLLLFLFSLGSWTIIIMKHRLYRQARRESEAFLEAFWKSRNLAEAHKHAQDLTGAPLADIFRTGYIELQKIGRARSDRESAEETLESRLAGMENLKRTLKKAETQQLGRLASSLSFLATTGSATPFIGLFGTVWGIMTSFQDIGQRGSASLAVVAPGISEALVATAAGLAVAIPAVIFFNFFNNQLVELETEMQGFSADFLNLVERDLISRI